MEYKEVPGANTPWLEIDKILKPDERFECIYHSVSIGFLFAPKSVSQLSALLFLCSERRLKTSFKIEINLSHSPQQVIISRRALNKIESIDSINNIIEVQAGCTLQEIHSELFAYRLELGLSPWIWQKDHATIGSLVEHQSCSGVLLQRKSVYSRLLGIEIIKPDGGLVKIGNQLLGSSLGFSIHKAILGTENFLGLLILLRFQVLPRPQKRIQLVWSFNNIDHQMFFFNQLKMKIKSWERLDLILSGNAKEKGFIIARISGSEEELRQFEVLCPGYKDSLKEDYAVTLLDFFHHKKLHFFQTLFQPKNLAAQNYLWYHSLTNVCWTITENDLSSELVPPQSNFLDLINGFAAPKTVSTGCFTI
jgi:FAD/FMN-containing dehydrogenase